MAEHGVGFGDSRQPVLRPNPRDMKVSTVYRQTAAAAIAAHVAGEPEQYGVRAWRQWVIVGVFGHWYAVRKDAPAAAPRMYKCSLAQAKANLMAGY